MNLIGSGLSCAMSFLLSKFEGYSSQTAEHEVFFALFELDTK